jgi:nardilysin
LLPFFAGDFLSHLLGHEAPGSLFASFRDQGLVASCMAGIGDDGSEVASTHALFSFSFNLTEKGLARWRSIVAKVYEYIGILRYYSEKGWPDWIYKELKQIHDLTYRFQNESSPDELVDEIVDNMAPHLMLPPERMLDGNSLFFEFRPDLVHNLLETFFTPKNCRIELTSSSFGRAADFKDDESFPQSTTIEELFTEKDDGEFRPSTANPPQVEPMFGTRFWCHSIDQQWLDELAVTRDPRPATSELFLPPRNPFVPENLSLMPLPVNDTRHILLNSSIKLCIPVGKSKQWLPGLVLQYDQTKNSVLISYEDEEEIWHVLDQGPSFFTAENVFTGFEGTMDKKKTKFKILALSSSGKPRRLLGDESDYDVLEGKSFPPIDPPAAPHRLPISISDTNTLKLWWIQDRTFHRPFADLRMQLICQNANASPLHMACAELMVHLCSDALTGARYQAELCELFSSLSVTDSGFGLRLHGFNDKMKTLLETTLKTVLSFRESDNELPSSITKDRFDVCLEIQRRGYKNSEMTSSGQASSIRMKALRPTVWSTNQKSRAIENIGVELFCHTIHDLFSQVSVESLLHGNFDRENADDVKTLILSLLKESGPCELPRKHYPPQSVLRIPTSKTPSVILVPSKDPQEPNTAVELYLQIGKDNLRERTMIDLLVHIMDEPMFDQLRTKDQFGYDVSCSERWSWGITGILFKVVTSVKSAEEIVERVDRFLAEFRETLVEMPNDVFHSHVVAVATQKLDMFNSLSEETSSYWDEIADGRFEWQAWRNEAVVLKSITKDDVISAFEKWLKPGIPRSMLIIKVIGTGESNSSKGRPDVDPKDVEEFCDSEVGKFHEKCNKQFWGRINAKLF